MKKATEAQTDVVTALPSESHEWDVYVGMHHAILDIQVINKGGVPQSILSAAQRLRWRCGGLIVSALVSGSSGPCSSPAGTLCCVIGQNT